MTRSCRGFVFVVLLSSACAPTQVSHLPVPMEGDRVRYSFTSDSARLFVARIRRVSVDTIVVDRLIPSLTGGAAEWTPASLPTATLARLEKRVGRRGNAVRGALIGGGVGVVLGFFCANEDPGWLTPTPAQCMIGYPLSGAVTGAAIGALIKSDVWMPIVRPMRSPVGPEPPSVSAAFVEIGVRLRLGAGRH